jgi:hypothetical protein
MTSASQQSLPDLRPASAPPVQNAVFQSDALKQSCTHEQQVQARIARANGYTNGPKCD